MLENDIIILSANNVDAIQWNKCTFDNLEEAVSQNNEDPGVLDELLWSICKSRDLAMTDPEEECDPILIFEWGKVTEFTATLNAMPLGLPLPAPPAGLAVSHPNEPGGTQSIVSE